MLQKYVSEYSLKQNAFHYDSLYNIILHNKQMIEAGQSNDFKIIGIFDTVNEAIEFNERFRKNLELLNGNMYASYYEDRGMKSIQKACDDFYSELIEQSKKH